MIRFPGLPAFVFLCAFLAVAFIPLQYVCALDNSAGQEREFSAAESIARQINLTPEERTFLKNHPVIRVGNEDDWPPFDFSEHGRPKGYAIDHLELLGQRLGISFEYVNGYTWFELLGLFRDREIDLLPCLWISEGRKRFMSFTEPYLELPYVIVASKDDKSIRTVKDLKGKRVAAARGYKQEEVLRTFYPEINIYQVQNALQGLEAVTYGEADAYIGYLGTVAYLMATRFLGSLQICGQSRAPELGPQGLHISVRPELHPLGNILQKAMDTVTDTEKVELAEKWIPVEKTSAPDLTTDEKVFLRKHPVLRVDNLKNWPPFNFNEKDRPQGFSIDYMKLLADKLGVEIEYVTGFVWGEFMDMLQTGDIDILCDVVETPNRKKTISFTEPYLTIFSGIVVRKGNERFAGLNDLAGRKVAVPKDFYYQEILKRDYPRIQIVVENDTLDCLRAVSSGKAAAALSEKPVFDYLINQHFLTDLKSVPIMESRYFDNTPVSIGVSKDRKILRNILQKAMDKVSQEERNRLYRRWLKQQDQESGRSKILFSPQERQWLEKREAISMCVDPSRLPFEEIDASGVHRGIAADIIALLEKRIGLPIRVVPTETWQESLNAMENGHCDLLSSVSKNSRDERGFVTSSPYIESVNVIVARSSQTYIPDLHALEGKKVAIARGNPVGSYLEDRFPGIRLFYYPDLDQTLQKVAKGKAEVAVGSLHRVSYAIHELGLYDLKIAGQTPYKEQLALGIRSDDLILNSIMNKALESLTDREVSGITRKWLSIRYDQGVNTALLLQILGAGLFLISLFVFWNRKLVRLNRELGIAHETLAVKSRELERLSITDTLTGLFNRMKLEDLLVNEIKRVKRTGQPFSVIMLDVDNFKKINDSYGHQAGDVVLREIARFLQASVRQADSLGRWGGEEFLILCPNTTGKGAAILAEHLRRLLSAQNFAAAGGVTCSFGVAEYRPEEGENQLLSRVDRAMYSAKRLGRNRVGLGG
ncbi:MAG: transporter substrate-binding domain-containing protein [Desulfobacteraceae bacterium]|nr:transporter substrate-binding domain-containing protein [Desulfobacteraceae bacterium]MCF8094346.1 transporter substrate-binding domain-containing protein [Desulfobacteraceae bacterium]